MGNVRWLLRATNRSIRSVCPSDETIHLYLDGELDPGARAKVLAHVETCDVCRGRLAAAEAWYAGLEDWIVPEPAPDLTDRVMQAVRAAGSTQERVQSEFGSVPPALFVVGLAALALATPLAVAALLWLFWPLLTGGVRNVAELLAVVKSTLTVAVRLAWAVWRIPPARVALNVFALMLAASFAIVRAIVADNHGRPGLGDGPLDKGSGQLAKREVSSQY